MGQTLAHRADNSISRDKDKADMNDNGSGNGNENGAQNNHIREVITMAVMNIAAIK